MKPYFPRGITVLLKLLARYFRPIITYLCSWVFPSANQRQGLQLRTMSDLELRDLGLGRSEIPALINSKVARHAADFRESIRYKPERKIEES